MGIGKWETSKKITACVAGIFLLLLAASASFGGYYSMVQRKISVQIHEQLKKANHMSLTYLQGTIRNQKGQMEAIASFCDAPDGSGQENWRRLLSEYGDGGAFRLGVADTDGLLVYGSRETKDISDKDYFLRACSGEGTVLSLEEQGMEGQDSLVLAAPIYGGTDQVQGALCAEYTTLGLGNILNTVETKGVGATMVIDRSGRLIASHEGMDYFDTIYDMLNTMEYDSEGAVEGLRESVERGESGYLVYYNNGHRARLLYHQPAQLEDWTILSLVVMEQYQQTIWEIVKGSYALGIVIFLIGIGILFLFALILYMRRKELKRGEKDYLTDVYNREAARKIFEKEMRYGENGGCCFFLDIDHFKQINDTLGHDAGDQALVQAAGILKQEMRRQDVISRYGGDEFCIWLWGLTDETLACNIAKRLLEAFRSRTQIRISLGITFFGGPEDTYEAVVKRADNGLYRAKEQGRDRYAVERAE